MDYSIAALFSENFALNKGPDNTFNQGVLIGKNSRFCHLIRPGFNDFIITKINGGMNDGTCLNLEEAQIFADSYS